MDDPRPERDLEPDESGRVPAAVEVLVVVADRRHGVGEEPEPADDLGALLRMDLHHGALGQREVAGLHQDRVGNGDLADVVEQRRVGEDLELVAREPDLAADAYGDLTHAPRVPCRVGIPGVDGRRQALECLGGPGAQQPVCVLERDVLPVDRVRRVLQPSLALA